jgi:hypothetical protein
MTPCAEVKVADKNSNDKGNRLGRDRGGMGGEEDEVNEYD